MIGLRYRAPPDPVTVCAPVSIKCGSAKDETQDYHGIRTGA